MARFRSFLANQSGNAAVETALMLPILLGIMFVCVEGGHYFYIEHQVVKGVRDGARFAARQPFTKFTCSTVDSTVADLVKEVTRTGVVSGGSTRVFGWDNTEVTVSASCPATAVTTGIYKGMANAPTVTVSATVPYPSLFKALGGLPTTAVVSARNQAAVMGV
jgi:Flp pilus assembly protein TadG